MRKIFIIGMMLSISISFAFAYGAPGDVELTLEDISINPIDPKVGDSIIITAEVSNSGIVQTNSAASIITIAFFVDDELLDVKDIGIVEPGKSNKIRVSSEPIWQAESGKHMIKVVLDYHDTLRDKYDSPDDNIQEKEIVIKHLNPTNLELIIHPKYGTQNKQNTLNVTASLTEIKSGKPIPNKEIIFNLNDEKVNLNTNENGTAMFSYINYFFDTFEISASFEGDDKYNSSNGTSTGYALPPDITTAMIMKMSDSEKKYNFEEYPFEIIIFKNTYQNIFDKIKPDSETLLDSKTFWITLPGENSYFTEVYMNGTFFASTDKEYLKEDSFKVKEIKTPEKASIKFKVVNNEGQYIKNGIVEIQTQSANIENGFTDWVNFLPVISSTTSQHTVKVILPEQNTTKTDSISIFPGERKVIILNIDEMTRDIEIPEWVKNNAGWWAENSIDDETFVQGIQFMINEGIMKVPENQHSQGLDSSKIPEWVKNNAGWWAENSIDDETFVQGIQFMINEGIITI